MLMMGRPREAEAAPYYFTYIDRVAGEDSLAVIESQLDESLALFADFPRRLRCTAMRRKNGAFANC
jgi:hypothetical protein